MSPPPSPRASTSPPVQGHHVLFLDPTFLPVPQSSPVANPICFSPHFPMPPALNTFLPANCFSSLFVITMFLYQISTSNQGAYSGVCLHRKILCYDETPLTLFSVLTFFRHARTHFLSTSSAVPIFSFRFPPAIPILFQRRCTSWVFPLLSAPPSAARLALLNLSA